MIECRVWRAESPMISIAQGKRSDTLGKPMRHVTPCKGKSPHNMLCFNAFSLLWRKLHGTLYPGPSCLGKRQSRAAAVLRASAPSGAFRLDDAPSFNKKRNRQVGRCAIKVRQAVALLPWGHILRLLQRVGDDDAAMLFYAKETRSKGWNRDWLLNAIKLNMYETQALARVDNNFDRTLPAEQAQYANEVFNSSYNLGFLGVTKYLKYHNENFSIYGIVGDSNCSNVMSISSTSGKILPTIALSSSENSSAFSNAREMVCSACCSWLQNQMISLDACFIFYAFICSANLGKKSGWRKPFHDS